mgnify:FL=1
MLKDHPIFLESIKFIRSKLGPHKFNDLEVEVLERLIHASGDFGIKDLLLFSKNACEIGLKACKSGAPILTDTEMAAVAVRRMTQETHGNLVISIKKWIDLKRQYECTASAYGMEKAWLDLSQNYFESKSPIVLIGSAPTALEKLLDIVDKTNNKPSLIIGMPVGFIGVKNAKDRLVKSNLNYISLGSTRGGAAMAAASINALLRASV